jgi:hypothetical protein
VVQVAYPAASRDRFVEDAPAGHFLDILAEVPDCQLLRDRDLSLVGGLLPRDHAEKRGLSGAVRPDESDLLAGIQLEGGLDEQDLAAVLLADAGEGDHRIKRTRRGGRGGPFWIRSGACAPDFSLERRSLSSPPPP